MTQNVVLKFPSDEDKTTFLKMMSDNGALIVYSHEEDSDEEFPDVEILPE